MLPIAMLAAIPETAKSDAQLTALLSRAAEYAEIYLLTKRRQKGCDGMGELAMIEEEFKETVDGLINYCKGKDCLANDFQYDLDTLADILIAAK